MPWYARLGFGGEFLDRALPITRPVPAAHVRWPAT
jgi:hypothetical protein